MSDLRSYDNRATLLHVFSGFVLCTLTNKLIDWLLDWWRIWYEQCWRLWFGLIPVFLSKPSTTISDTNWMLVSPSDTRSVVVQGGERKIWVVLRWTGGRGHRPPNVGRSHICDTWFEDEEIPTFIQHSPIHKYKWGASFPSPPPKNRPEPPLVQSCRLYTVFHRKQLLPFLRNSWKN